MRRIIGLSEDTSIWSRETTQRKSFSFHCFNLSPPSVLLLDLVGSRYGMVFDGRGLLELLEPFLASVPKGSKAVCFSRGLTNKNEWRGDEKEAGTRSVWVENELWVQASDHHDTERARRKTAKLGPSSCRGRTSVP